MSSEVLRQEQSVLAGKETVSVEGDDVQLYIYAQKYRYPFAKLAIRKILGYPTRYTKRYIRAEASEVHESSYRVENISLKQQKEELLDSVRSSKQEKKSLMKEVM